MTHLRAIPDAPLPILDSCQQEYALDWATSADRLLRDRHYEWMAQFIADYQRVVEIGAGTGRSTEVIAKNGHSVVSVDENPFCLRMAEAHLRAAHVPVHVQASRAQRALVLDAPEEIPEARAVLYAPISGAKDPETGEVLLLESDVLLDPELFAWLRILPLRDAVTCWLIGIHKAVHFQAQLGFKGTDPHMYRVRVQNDVYRLADSILRPGGLLHIVDRMEWDTDELRANLLRAHSEMATLGKFSVESLEMRPYDLGSMHEEVQIQNHRGAIAVEKSIYLCSILIRKTE